MENKTLDSALTIGAFIIGIIGLIMGIMIMRGNESVVGPAITLSMVVMGVAAAVAILFGLFHFLTNIKRNIPMLIGIVVFVILAIVCYTLASDTVLQSYDPGITESESKLSGAGLLIMYVLVVVAAGAAIVGEITRIFK
ncbi:hypothetical protein G3O08_10100 [Cryomorpha ignava]|uniref:Uncharacterized protein n=1 Tax=Cryomorpha ignava TaxID=101383 RepID=A0A7K3WSJ6_9FLAO|nr:hypothetical protein [Cryomorpha ignava]NEN23852.1 hypothetical protein [Cryomorpha ignava]